MKKIIFVFAAAVLLLNTRASAQKLYTKNGSISFFSKAPLEDISATNSQVTSILILPSAELQFSVLIKAFRFKKSLMEEHFNENYLESDKYPKAIFKGTIDNTSSINFTADGIYPAKVSGDLTLHGITKKITALSNLTIKAGIITGTSTFKLRLADFHISIPSIVKDNISETVEVTVSCVYDQKL